MQHQLALLAALGCGSCTAVAAGARPPEEHVPSADGVEIAFEESGGGEPTLVFVHGWCGERGLWRTTMEALAPTHHVLALDLAGHGGSGNARARWSLDSLADDVVAVVEATKSQDVILIGHSLGATVALLAAPRLAPRVRGVIGVEGLHDAGVTYEPETLAAVARELQDDFPRALEGLLRGTVAPDMPPELFDWLRARTLRTDRGAALGLLRALEGFALAPVLAAAGVPVRVVNAAPRTGTPPTALATNRALADFDALFLPDMGHFPMLEHFAHFLPLLERWILELSARAGSAVR